jgi:hypothetical protein
MKLSSLMIVAGALLMVVAAICDAYMEVTAVQARERFAGHVAALVHDFPAAQQPGGPNDGRITAFRGALSSQGQYSGEDPLPTNHLIQRTCFFTGLTVLVAGVVAGVLSFLAAWGAAADQALHPTDHANEGFRESKSLPE